ncbi:hypothetical protein RPE78_00120 [Thioclava litoralis]|uniref:Uncharacterized protein n=1 Tax=Thioclava litoralis TaxID=3076557 RepID=A0ABZ1E1B1_9RHOB|nr:hypothetical protein RPE78_00120 [Thioclava sp. FTW29]
MAWLRFLTAVIVPTVALTLGLLAVYQQGAAAIGPREPEGRLAASPRPVAHPRRLAARPDVSAPVLFGPAARGDSPVLLPTRMTPVPTQARPAYLRVEGGTWTRSQRLRR